MAKTAVRAQQSGISARREQGPVAGGLFVLPGDAGADQVAQGQFDTAQAQVQAQQAQTRAAQTQTGFFSVRAPFHGVVSDVPVTLGDMAMPGRPSVTLHDPWALRVSAAVPQSIIEGVRKQLKSVRYEIAGHTSVAAASVQMLPAVDPVDPLETPCLKRKEIP
jgi:multidrug resistance efflux pump